MKKSILFLLLLVMLGLTGCGKTTVDLNKYVTIETNGYDGFGHASYFFDFDAFKEDYSEKIKFSSSYEKELVEEGIANDLLPYELLFDKCITAYFDKEFELTNGENVTLIWECKDDIALEYFNCELDYTNIEYPVSNLQEIEEINPFDYLLMEYVGIAPHGCVYVNVDVRDEESEYLSFSVEPQDGLDIGDTITVKASIAREEEFIVKFGKKLGKEEETFVVDALPSYIKDISEIPQETLQKMEKQGEDAFKAYVAKKWDNPENLQSVECIGHYLLSKKEGMLGTDNNIFYCVYKISAINPNPKETIEFYYFASYKDIVKMVDGTCSVDLNVYEVPNSSDRFYVGNYYYYGFENIESLFNRCVTQKVDSYNYVSSLNE